MWSGTGGGDLQALEALTGHSAVPHGESHNLNHSEWSMRTNLCVLTGGTKLPNELYSDSHRSDDAGWRFWDNQCAANGGVVGHTHFCHFLVTIFLFGHCLVTVFHDFRYAVEPSPGHVRCWDSPLFGYLLPISFFLLPCAAQGTLRHVSHNLAYIRRWALSGHYSREWGECIHVTGVNEWSFRPWLPSEHVNGQTEPAKGAEKNHEWRVKRIRAACMSAKRNCPRKTFKSIRKTVWKTRKRIRKTIPNATEKVLAPLRPPKNISPALFNKL